MTEVQTCDTCERSLTDPWATEPVPGVTVPGGELLRHVTCPPGTCASCGTVRPYAELRIANLGGEGEDDPDMLACSNVYACQVRAGELDPDDVPQAYR